MSLDHVLSALSDPTRRAIIFDLQVGERRISDLAAPHAMSLNAVSKHVKTLEGAGLVHRRQVGRNHFISVNPAPLRDAADWFTEQAAFWTERLDALELALNEDDKNGGTP